MASYYKGKKGQPRVKGTCGNLYRNKEEKALGSRLEKAGIEFQYEPKDGRLKYTRTSSHHYSPDFVLNNGVILEFKGYFPREDWKKMLAVRECNPERLIKFVFMDSTKMLTRGKKNFPRTYGDWCDKHGFDFVCLTRMGPKETLSIIKEWDEVNQERNKRREDNECN